MLGNPVYMKMCITYLFATSVGSLMPVSALWAQGCSVEARNQRFPSAVSAIDHWSVQNNVGVGTETTNLILDDFCQAANVIQAKKDVRDTAINKVASEVMFEYLDSENDSSSTSVSNIGAILRTALGASGFAAQRLKRLAILKLNYKEKNIDYVEIDGSQISPYGRIMHTPGRYLGKGIQGTTVVCTFRVELIVNQEKEATCQ